MTELLPCPFCGTEPDFMNANAEKSLSALVHCLNEKCGVQPSLGAYTNEQAVAMWNDRADVPQARSHAQGASGKRRAIELLIKLQTIGDATIYRLASEAQQMLELDDLSASRSPAGCSPEFSDTEYVRLANEQLAKVMDENQRLLSQLADLRSMLERANSQRDSYIVTDDRNSDEHSSTVGEADHG